MTLKLDLTIAIPVKNEEKNLPACLQAIGSDLARHVVVIDSASSDQTVDIAYAYGAEVVMFNWNGKFPKKRNWFLRNYNFKTKWVLFLDADEFLTEEFKQELRQALNCGDKTGFWLNYTIYFLGKQLKGGYPLRKLALFQVGAGEYEYIEENMWSSMDMEVHEHPILHGNIGQIYSKIDHRDFSGVAHYIQKHNEYSGWEALRFITSTSDPEKIAKWTWIQRLKYRLMGSILIGLVFFIGSFFFLGGFRDGARGLAFAIFKMAYFTQIYCKIREAKENKYRKNFTKTSSPVALTHENA